MGNLTSKENKILSDVVYDVNMTNKKLICDKVLSVFAECYPNINFQNKDVCLKMRVQEIGSSNKTIIFVLKGGFNDETKDFNEACGKLTINGKKVLYQMFTNNYANYKNVSRDIFRYFHRCIVRSPRITYELLMAQKFRKNSIPNLIGKDVLRIIIKKYLCYYFDIVCDLTIKKYNLIDYNKIITYKHAKEITEFINILPYIKIDHDFCCKIIMNGL